MAKANFVSAAKDFNEAAQEAKQKAVCVAEKAGAAIALSSVEYPTLTPAVLTVTNTNSLNLEKILNGFGGALYSVANNFLEGHIGTMLLLGDALLGTSSYNAFERWLSSVEANIIINYVTDDTWFYGGCLVGDIASIVVGAVETVSGFSTIGGSITSTAAGVVATSTGVGAGAGAPVIVVSIPTVLVGACEVVGGVGTICYSIDNLDGHYSAFTGSNEDNTPSNKSISGLGNKTENYIRKRGWSLDSINELYRNPYTTRQAHNKATGNSATVYYNQQGDYIVVDDITGELVQLSEYGNTDWIPDSSIVDPYVPNK